MREDGIRTLQAELTKIRTESAQFRSERDAQAEARGKAEAEAVQIARERDRLKNEVKALENALLNEQVAPGAAQAKVRELEGRKHGAILAQPAGYNPRAQCELYTVKACHVVVQKGDFAFEIACPENVVIGLKG